MVLLKAHAKSDIQQDWAELVADTIFPHLLIRLRFVCFGVPIGILHRGLLFHSFPIGHTNEFLIQFK